MQYSGNIERFFRGVYLILLMDLDGLKAWRVFYTIISYDHIATVMRPDRSQIPLQRTVSL